MVVNRKAGRTSAFAFLLASSAVVADNGNAALFADCEVWERHLSSDAADATDDEYLAITRCGMYFMGAFDTLQFRHEGQCRLEGVSANDVILQYLAYNRRTGVSNTYRGGPAWKVMDACHCGGQPALPEDVCNLSVDVAP